MKAHNFASHRARFFHTNHKPKNGSNPNEIKLSM